MILKNVTHYNSQFVVAELGKNTHLLVLYYGIVLSFVKKEKKSMTSKKNQDLMFYNLRRYC